MLLKQRRIQAFVGKLLIFCFDYRNVLVLQVREKAFRFGKIKFQTTSFESVVCEYFIEDIIDQVILDRTSLILS